MSPYLVPWCCASLSSIAPRRACCRRLILSVSSPAEYQAALSHQNASKLQTSITCLNSVANVKRMNSNWWTQLSRLCRVLTVQILKRYIGCWDNPRFIGGEVHASDNMYIRYYLCSFFRFLWPCIMNVGWRERETNKMQLIWCLLSNFYLNMFRASLCPSSGEQ